MQNDIVSLIDRLAPDLSQEIAKRALVLERVSVLQPIGRRQLAKRLELAQREVRSISDILRQQGFLSFSQSGICLTDEGMKNLDGARILSKRLSGLADLERKLSSIFGIEHISVVFGNAEEDQFSYTEAARLLAVQLKSLLHQGCILAVSGGKQVKSVVEYLQPMPPMDVMVVPLQGIVGKNVDEQADMIAANAANQLGGHHRMLHVPDSIDEEILDQMRQLTKIGETIELIKRADLVLCQIDSLEEARQTRNMRPSFTRKLLGLGVVAETLGCFYSSDGSEITESGHFAKQVGCMKQACKVAGIALGTSKTASIIAGLRSKRFDYLVIDESAARKVLEMVS